MVSISDIENGRYYWETVNPHADNTETANDYRMDYIYNSV
nr:MAG TPA: hypothetical protein [Caudoviricetes sp.]